MCYTEWVGIFATDSRSFTTDAKFKFLVVSQKVALKNVKDYFFLHNELICSFLPPPQIAKTDLEKKKN